MAAINFDKPSEGVVSDNNTVALNVRAKGEGTIAIQGETEHNKWVAAVEGISKNWVGVHGISNTSHSALWGEARGEAGIGVWGETTHDKGGAGVVGKSKNWIGVYGESQTYQGVHGESTKNAGVVGHSAEGWGVYGVSDKITGVQGESKDSIGVGGVSTNGAGVYGVSTAADGVKGVSTNAAGVAGSSTNSFGIWGYSTGPRAAIYGESTAADGVEGVSDGGNGVYGSSRISTGVKGESSGGFDESEDDRGKGVVGKCDNGIGVNGFSKKGFGVAGFGHSEGIGVIGVSYTQTGVYGQSDDGFGVYGAVYGNGYAAYLDGKVYIRGPLYKPGGWFRIDHPLDPANKYLCHSFVESPDMKNIYDGMVTLDNKGEAEIDLPDWFGALNKNYRYQLTAIGAPGPKLYIAKEISESSTDYFGTANKNNANNHSSFKIAGGTSGMKVSWQVTGIRKDPWANAHRVQVEEDKPDRERGYYIYPELHDQPADRGISTLNFPEGKKVPFVTKRK